MAICLGFGLFGLRNMNLMAHVPKDGVEKGIIEKLETAYGEDVRKAVVL